MTATPPFIYRRHTIRVSGCPIGSEKRHLGEYEVFVDANQSRNASIAAARNLIEDRIGATETPLSVQPISNTGRVIVPTAVEGRVGPYANVRKIK